MTNPIPFRWEGDCFTPMPGFGKRCDELFVVGQAYRLVEQEDRSAASHRHYFACINTAWENLPERLSADFPTPDHLRRFALIRAGYADSRTLVASSKAEAVRLAAFVKPMDSYAVVVVTDATVTVWTARSQSAKAMGKKDFQESKDAVLDVIAGLIGTDPATLSAQAGQAA
ncbi:hypothetical protein [Azospirillum tabaci]|uniref:hypothetical protein n=1 Tax=Azospirillum tabaci TaxID=2752310 RepID=UPI00166176DA|nr:hypothetical protein [Azospirillum tabaci]